MGRKYGSGSGPKQIGGYDRLVLLLLVVKMDELDFAWRFGGSGRLRLNAEEMMERS